MTEKQAFEQNRWVKSRSDSEIPVPESPADSFARLAGRWLPASPRDRPLHEMLEAVTDGVRRAFREILG